MTGDTGDTENKEGKFSGISSIPLKEQKQYRVSSVSPVTLFYRIGLNVTCPFEFRGQCYIVPIPGLLAPDFAIASMLEEGAKFPFG